MATADGIGVIGRGKSHIRIGGDHEEVKLLGEANPALRSEGTVRYENPTSINLAREVAASGEPHSHRRHNVFSPDFHKCVFPLLMWETCLPNESTLIFLAPTRDGIT